jgi:hypothetical protein
MSDNGYIDFLENDLAAIMDSRALDQPMEFQPEDGEPVSFRGLFSAPTEEQNPGTANAPTTAQNYSVAYKETDLPRRLKRGDLIAARGQLWRVYKIMSDGQGLLTVNVQKAQS